MEKVLFFAILSGVIVLLAFLAQKRFSQNRNSSPSSNGRGANSPAPPAAQAAPQPTPAATTTRSQANTSNPRPILKWVLIGIAVIIGIDLAAVGGRALLTYSKGMIGSSVISRTPVTNLSHGVPAEIALPIICGCESTGMPGVIKHYEDDGVTPLRNRPKPGKAPTSAKGGCQIMASLHEKRAKDEFHLDINTPEGNMTYAKVLYGESGTKAWEADSDSVSCWEPKLRAFSWGGEAVTLVVQAPKETWSSPPVSTPYAPRRWELNGFGKKYKVLWNGQVEEDLPRAKNTESKQPEVVYNFQLKSNEKEPVSIAVKFF